MKTSTLFFRTVMIAVAIYTSTLMIHASGDFYAWELKSGHAGLSGGAVDFTEKSITIEFWMYLNEDTSGELTAIMGTTNGDEGFLISVRKNSTNEDALDLRLFAKDSEKNTAHFFVPREQFIDKWVHIAYVISAEDEKAYLYINGGYVDEKDAIGGYLGNSSVNLAIGQWWSDPKPLGKLAEIRIWNVARTDTEIAENYNQRIKGSEPGLFLYYNFDNFDQTITNVANPGVNNGSLEPIANWIDVHDYEVLSAAPTSLKISGNTVSWEGNAENYEIEIIEQETNEIVKEDVVETKSYTLTDLDSDKNYLIKLRAKTSLFYSNWVSIATGTSGVKNLFDEDVKVIVKNNSIIIKSEMVRNIHVYSIDGSLLKSAEMNVGETVITDVPRGIYLVDKQKVVVY